MTKNLNGNIVRGDVLTISAKEYCESVGEKLVNFELHGIHLTLLGPEVIHEFRKPITKVVSFMPHKHTDHGALSGTGTALVRRK